MIMRMENSGHSRPQGGGLLLALISASLGFCAMLILGLPLTLALPLTIFMGFFSQVIPPLSGPTQPLPSRSSPPCSPG